jgi:hypothetical protein
MATFLLTPITVHVPEMAADVLLIPIAARGLRHRYTRRGKKRRGGQKDKLTHWVLPSLCLAQAAFPTARASTTPLTWGYSLGLTIPEKSPCLRILGV